MVEMPVRDNRSYRRTTKSAANPSGHFGDNLVCRKSKYYVASHHEQHESDCELSAGVFDRSSAFVANTELWSGRDNFPVVPPLHLAVPQVGVPLADCHKRGRPAPALTGTSPRRTQHPRIDSPRRPDFPANRRLVFVQRFRASKSVSRSSRNPRA